MTQQNKGIALPKRRGVTLIEIAIVLVIIGILLGGVLKGQELINNARVRALADQQNSLKVGWFAFLDRFGGMPADYVFASQYIRDAEDGGGDGIITEGESVQAFQQLTAAGYLRCQQCTYAKGDSAPSTANSLLNPYSGIMGIFHNGQFGEAVSSSTTAAAATEDNTYATDLSANPKQARLMIHSGPLIPSNIATEVDLKIDDGLANQGEVVFNSWKQTGTEPPVADCTSTKRDSQTAGVLVAATTGDELFWRHASVNPIANCGMSNNL